MAKALDFNAVKKQIFTITLPDEKQTKLLITTPDKKTFTKFVQFKNSISDRDDEGVLDDMYDMVGEIMSHNKAGKKITGKYLSTILDFEDLIIFIREYNDYISGIVNSKN
jgi:hypothetical protein